MPGWGSLRRVRGLYWGTWPFVGTRATIRTSFGPHLDTDSLLIMRPTYYTLVEDALEGRFGAHQK
jgi:hypothetical protein